jgi:hypothetical protein|tara:strand:- start:1149 stop:1307 length:159 start_codon:yes stop_codon:yes gene_type:complete
MTEPFWTKERRDDYKALVKKREHRRRYLREYMRKARGKGKYPKKSYQWSSSK